MTTTRILKVILLLLGGVFILLQAFALETKGAAISTLMLILLTTLYYGWTEKRTKYFFWFLLLFTIGDLFNFISYCFPLKDWNGIDFYYYITNVFYILSYTTLIVKLLKDLNVRTVFSKLPIPIIILVVLDVFCVTLVTAAAENELTVYQYALEFTYNAVIMTLLSAALINYMYRNDNKSMLLLLGSIFIFFSEMIQLAYYYILENNNNLSFVYSLFLVVAFIFFYLQSQLEFTGPELEYVDELEV